MTCAGHSLVDESEVGLSARALGLGLYADEVGPTPRVARFVHPLEVLAHHDAVATTTFETRVGATPVEERGGWGAPMVTPNAWRLLVGQT